MKRSNPFRGSFRDPSGFIFIKDNSICRQINPIYKEHYDCLIESGLFRELVDKGLLVSHEELELSDQEPGEAYKIIQPEPIPFISYPYEWSFSQLKDAALATLEIQMISLRYDMSLKDASSYNIQFRGSKATLIDTLSFERYKEGSPWIAYRQFCQHFLASLSLMSQCDIRLGLLLRDFIDGIPLDLASSLLPLTSKFKPSLLAHIHMHAKSQKYFGGKSVDLSSSRVGKRSMLGLIDNLQASVRRLKWCPSGTEWADYYEDNNYTTRSFEDKKAVVAKMIGQINPSSVMDLGANMGHFSRIASQMGIYTISSDVDPSAVEKNYMKCKLDGENNLLPLLIDLVNPSPSIGWANCERDSWHERSPADMAMALALIHHLAISNNLPFSKIANYFSGLCSHLIIEFVPKSDSQVKRLLLTREDIFDEYERESFEMEFEKYFRILSRHDIIESERSLYLMQGVNG